MPTTTRILFTANALGLALFLGLAFILPLHGQNQSEQRFTQLQQAGAVNPANIAKLKIERSGAGTGAGPWIAAGAITASRSAANVGIGLTLLNVTLFTAATWKSSKATQKSQR